MLALRLRLCYSPPSMSNAIGIRPLDKLLYVRVDSELLKALEEIMEDTRRVRPGAIVTQAGIVREILWEAVQQWEKRKKIVEAQGRA